MEKHIGISVIYEIPIKEYECVKKFLSELSTLSKDLGKGFYWESFVEQVIEDGLRVVFLHLFDSKDHWDNGIHFKKEMVFGVFMGFNSYSFDLQRMGTYTSENIENLCHTYESNPDFIFTKLDWKNMTKEEIIDDFINELKQWDIVVNDDNTL